MGGATRTTDHAPQLIRRAMMGNIIEEKGMTALLESLLERTRQEIADQGQVVDPVRLELERELEQAVIDAHLDDMTGQDQ